MQTTTLRKYVSWFLCIVLIAAMALGTSGCTTNPQSGGTSTVIASLSDPIVMGEGETVFPFHVVDGEGKTTVFEIHTDETIVGAALLELELIDGDAGPYGLYVKTVNGVTLDYEKDKKYWAFYENDAYGATGVDQTAITDGVTYAFRVE